MITLAFGISMYLLFKTAKVSADNIGLLFIVAMICDVIMAYFIWGAK